MKWTVLFAALCAAHAQAEQPAPKCETAGQYDICELVNPTPQLVKLPQLPDTRTREQFTVAL